MPDALESMLRVIVSEEFPTSLEAFDIEAHREIVDAQAGQAKTTIDRGGHAGFGGSELLHAADYIKLISATVTLVAGLQKLFHKEKPPAADPADLQQKWEDEMRRSGLNKEKARRIAAKFAHDLESLLKH